MVVFALILQLLLTAACIAHLDVSYSPSVFEEAKIQIRNSFKLNRIGSDFSANFPECKISETELCNINQFTPDISSLVYPGGSTRCIFSYSTPYSFQVIPGDSDKLIFYFQDGGACWDKISTFPVPLCTTDATPYGLEGLLDRSNPDNTFKSYTVVIALYCSGDVFGGNVTRDYDDNQGVPVSQQGYANAKATLDWVLQQQSGGYIASPLTDLVIMGSSAGSMGAQVWSPAVLQQVKYLKAAVVADSFIGFFPEGTEGPLVKDYGFCSTTLLDSNAALKALCYANKLSMTAMMNVFMASFPSVPFTFLQSKEDKVQLSYYIAVAATCNVSAIITPSQFYSNCTDILISYNKYPNMIVYLIDGTQHMFTVLSLYYNANAKSADGSDNSSKGPLLFEWVGKLPLNTNQTATTVCNGRPKTADGGGSGAVEVEGERYCPAELLHKTYMQQ